MEKAGADYTDAFRILGEVKTDSSNFEQIIQKLIKVSGSIKFHNKKNYEGYAAILMNKLNQILQENPKELEKLGIGMSEAQA